MGDYKLHWPKIVLFGDSLTQRSFEPRDGLWGALIADRLQRICDVIPRGFSGYNTRMCKLILPRIFHKENVLDIEAFIICLGANDSCGENSQQHVSLNEYTDNLTHMVEYLKSIGLKQEKIILMSPPPYHEDAYKAYCEVVGRILPVKNNDTVGKYAAACCYVAEQCGIDSVDLYNEMLKDQNWPRYLMDGLHFSHAGAVLVYTILWPYIAKRTDTLKPFLPVWSDIDPNCPEMNLLPSEAKDIQK